ncbi:MAG: non-ribosomal peptide synthetase, partial [bacterium]|nr:non-ribosomal peptide synthetase [bacterium]
MVPSAFVVLDALPLTPAGKVDRSALQRRSLTAERTRVVAEEGMVVPGDPTEELLAGIWAGVLGVERVGTQENFFELGGHSLLATQVASRIREAFAVEVPLPRLFEAPTVAELAGVVRLLRREQQGVTAPPLVPVARDRELPLSFAQQRLWFLDRFEPGTSTYNVPLAVRLHGSVAAGLLERIFNEVVRRHEVLRTTLVADAGEPRQVIAAELDLPLPTIDLESLSDRDREVEARRLATAEARRPFDLATGPLIRSTLLGLATADTSRQRRASSDHLLLVTMHHIVSDGWSMGVLQHELTALFDAFSQGQTTPLPELPVQYADYAHWQQQWMTGETLEAELAYWREQLAGAPPYLE